MANSTGHGYFKVCPSCHKRFLVCVKCDREHRYCSDKCKDAGRLSTFRRSSKLYQSSDNGRMNHRKRQKTYRKNRRLKESVTQHSFPIIEKDLNIKPVGFAQNPNFITTLSEPKATQNSVCQFCHRKVEWFIRSG